MVFYLRSRTHLSWDSVETLETRSWKGDEEGGLEHIAIAVHWRRHVDAMRHRVSGAFAVISCVFLRRHFYCVSHTSDVEGLNFTGLIPWDLYRFFYVLCFYFCCNNSDGVLIYRH